VKLKEEEQSIEEPDSEFKHKRDALAEALAEL